MDKDKIITFLKNHGDTISTISINSTVLNNRYLFVEANGSTKNKKKRGSLMKQIHEITIINKSLYRFIMSKPISAIKLKLEEIKINEKRKKLFKELIEKGYKENYLKNRCLEDLEQLLTKSPYIKLNRQDMIYQLEKNTDWSQKTLNSWNTEKLKKAFIKDLQNKYSPLTESLPKRITPEEKNEFEFTRRSKTRKQYLHDLSDALFYDIIGTEIS